MDLNIGVGEYRKEDYEEILRISDDRDDMDQTWKEWKSGKNKALENFQKMGLKTEDVIVLPRELVKFCRENGFRINGKSRSEFISYKVMKLREK